MTDWTQILKLTEGHRTFIQTHNFPDPDAIAAALGLQRLLLLRGVTTGIIYVGKIDKFSTALMVDTFGVTLINADDVPDMTIDDKILIVDAQKYNANIRDIAGDEVVCVDHHPIFEAFQYGWSDIRPQVGACSSIIASYFFDSGEIPDMVTSTALLYGIKMDTLEMSRGVSDLDIEMTYRLYKLADLGLLQKMHINVFEFNDLVGFGEAIKNVRIYDNLGVARIDTFCPDGLIAAISDFILSLIEVEIAIIYCLRPDGVKLSVRCEVENKDAGKAAAAALKGIGSGGGHASMAGGFIPFDPKVGDIDVLIRDRFLAAFGEQG